MVRASHWHYSIQFCMKGRETKISLWKSNETTAYMQAISTIMCGLATRMCLINTSTRAYALTNKSQVN